MLPHSWPGALGFGGPGVGLGQGILVFASGKFRFLVFGFLIVSAKLLFFFGGGRRLGGGL